MKPDETLLSPTRGEPLAAGMAAFGAVIKPPHLAHPTSFAYKLPEETLPDGCGVGWISLAFVSRFGPGDIERLVVKTGGKQYIQITKTHVRITPDSGASYGTRVGVEFHKIGDDEGECYVCINGTPFMNCRDRRWISNATNDPAHASLPPQPIQCVMDGARLLLKMDRFDDNAFPWNLASGPANGVRDLAECLFGPRARRGDDEAGLLRGLLCAMQAPSPSTLTFGLAGDGNRALHNVHSRGGVGTLQNK